MTNRNRRDLYKGSVHPGNSRLVRGISWVDAPQMRNAGLELAATEKLLWGAAL